MTPQTADEPVGQQDSVDLPESLAMQIRADAGDRESAELADIQVVSVYEELFSDSSLGCPESGSFYAQVITPGWVVIVEAGDAIIDYRVARSGSFRFVIRERPRSSGGVLDNGLAQPSALTRPLPKKSSLPGFPRSSAD